MLTQGASEGFNLTLQHKTLDQSNLKLMSSMTDAIFREAIIIKKKHSDFCPISYFTFSHVVWIQNFEPVPPGLFGPPCPVILCHI